MNFDWTKAPSWAKWIAVDYNGEMWVFENKPGIDRENYMWEVKSGWAKLVGYLYQSDDWHTMIERKEKNA